MKQDVETICTGFSQILQQKHDFYASIKDKRN